MFLDGNIYSSEDETSDKKKALFDIIFLDPPYDGGLGQKALDELARLPIWKRDAFIFFECRNRDDEQKKAGELNLLSSKVYGQTKILVYSFLAK